MRLFKNTNYLILEIATFTILGLMALAFPFAWAKDEGTLGDGLLTNILADSFLIFRYPFGPLLERVEIPHPFSFLYLLGLIANALIFGWIVERVFFFLKYINR